MRLSQYFDGLLKRKDFQYLLLAVMILSLIPWKGLPLVGEYIGAHYLLTYEDAFMPRALIGTLYLFITRYIRSETFFLLLYLLLLYGYFCMAREWLKLIAKTENSEHLSLLFILCMALPTTYMAILADFGRFDAFLIAIAILCTFLTVRESGFRFMIPLLVITGFLIHEAFLVLFCPLILALQIWKLDLKRKNTIMFAVLTLASVIVCIGIMIYFKATFPPCHILESNILQRNNLQFHPLIFSCGDFRSFYDNILHIFEFWARSGERTVSYVISIFCGITALTYPNMIWFSILRKAKKASQTTFFKYVFLWLSTLAPMGMCCLGGDFTRWFAASLACNFMLLVMILSDKNERFAPESPGNVKTMTVLCLVIFFIPQTRSSCFYFSQQAEDLAKFLHEEAKSVRMSFFPDMIYEAEGLELIKQGKFSEALPLLQKAADAGYTDAGTALGICLLDGNGCQKDAKKAFQLFKFSAQKGNDKARYMTGICLFYGYGTKQDTVEGIAWIKKATRREHCPLADYFLAKYYRNGNPTPADYGKSFFHLRRAIAVPDACYDLALHYLSGIYVPVDSREAFIWANIAAKSNHPGGQYILACLILSGNDCERNENEVKRLLKASSAQGYSKAKELLSRLDAETGTPVQ